ncbi:carnitine O-acetyltransferase b isoform X2 [Anguilla anguilla]|uniref:carnitine O-acetyltransferase b isoform X2 n=1 Tax=Anguilla anguilla TaxID=7936 RepID=UPI0015A808EA|nr:carnitine O-acetyltransferase b isoform X2 [Anguilla anguilla]
MLLKKIPSAKNGAWLFQAVFGQSVRSLSVPPQPVPTLAQTLQGYLRVLEPLLPPDELAHTREVVRKFGAPDGRGEQLQRGLEKRARNTHNWISDWWVKWAYLEDRQPLAVHSNPAIALPKQDYTDWRGQLLFASKLIAGVLDFKAKVDSGCLPVEYMRGQPLCMELFPLLFSSCRIPGPKHDHIFHYSQARRPPTHITVVRNYQFFQLEVYNSNGTPLTQSQIHDQLCRIRSQSWKTDKEPVGILTSEHRHTWGTAYHRLLRGTVHYCTAHTPGAWPTTACSEVQYTTALLTHLGHGLLPPAQRYSTLLHWGMAYHRLLRGTVHYCTAHTPGAWPTTACSEVQYTTALGHGLPPPAQRYSTLLHCSHRTTAERDITHTGLLQRGTLLTQYYCREGHYSHSATAERDITHTVLLQKGTLLTQYYCREGHYSHSATAERDITHTVLLQKGTLLTQYYCRKGYYSHSATAERDITHTVLLQRGTLLTQYYCRGGHYSHTHCYCKDGNLQKETVIL